MAPIDKLFIGVLFEVTKKNPIFAETKNKIT